MQHFPSWIRPVFDAMGRKPTTQTPLIIVRFLLVGALSTVSTFATLYIAVEHLQSNVVLASTIGWLFGAILNYTLNYRYTFRSNAKHQLAIPRFVIVVASGIIINASLMILFFHTLKLHYFVAQLAAVSFTVLASFSLNRFWTFTSRP